MRQVFVGCTDRGEFLGRVRRAHAHYLHELLERIRTLEATERERELQRLRAEVDALSAKLGKAGADVKKSKFAGLMRGAAAEAGGGAEAKIEERRQSTKAPSHAQALLQLFVASSAASRPGVAGDDHARP